MIDPLDDEVWERENVGELHLVAPLLGVAALLTSPVLTLCCGLFGIMLGTPLPLISIGSGLLLMFTSVPHGRRWRSGAIAAGLGFAAMALSTLACCGILTLSAGLHGNSGPW